MQTPAPLIFEVHLVQDILSLSLVVLNLWYLRFEHRLIRIFAAPNRKLTWPVGPDISTSYVRCSATASIRQAGRVRPVGN